MNDTNPHALILPAPAPAPTGGVSNAMADQLRDIKAPVDIPGEWTWLWWVLAVLVGGVLLSALFVWLYRSRQKALYVPPIPPHVRALERLAQALALMGDDAKLFCIEVSTAIRVYLEEQFQLRAPERTTEEFLRELQTSTILNPAQKQSLEAFLTQCDLVKFARYQPTQAELKDTYDAAVRLVEETTPKPVVPGAEQAAVAAPVEPPASTPAPPAASA